MRYSLTFTAAILSLTICSLGCSSDQRSDSASEGDVPIIRTASEPQYISPLFDLNRDLVLGIDDGEPEWQLFTRLFYPLIAPDGRMYLPDYGRNEIYIVHTDGTLLARAGGPGSGPGEFQWIAGLFWTDPGHEFWAFDRRLNRFSSFTADGEFIRTQVLGQQQGQYDWFVGLNDRMFLGLTSGSMREETNNRYSFLTEHLEVIREFIAVPPQQMWHDEKGGGWGMIHYTEMDGVVASPDGHILSYHPYLPRITLYTHDGIPIRHIEHHWEFPKVTEEEREVVRSNYRDNPRNENFRHWATDMPFPKTHAAFDFVLPDDQDRIWVRRTGTQRIGNRIIENIFDVFDLDGTWLGTQELPYEPAAILGEHVYFTYEAESGSQRFARYVLIPRH